MALPININELLTGETVEWDRIEFKKGWNPLAVIHTVTAFANDMNNWGGGYLFIGVEEKDGLPILPPIGLDARELDVIQKEILKMGYKISPNYFPVCQPYIKDGKHILVLWCPGGDNRPYQAPSALVKNAEKKFYIRRNSSTKQASAEEKNILQEIAQKIPFDDRINHHASIEDLSFVLIREHLETVKSDLRKELANISIQDLAKQMQLIAGVPEDLRPKNVALLLFNENPTRFFRGAYTDFVSYQDISGKNFTEKQFNGPIQHQLLNVLDFIENNVIIENVVKHSNTAQAERFYNFPFDAVEEAIANAYYHRSYEHQNPVEISIYPDKIQILSFPGPLPPITVEMLKQRKIVSRDYRNRRIGDFFKELKLTEGRATGFPTIYDSMEENGSPRPVFETDVNFNYFLCTLPIHPHFLPYHIDNREKRILEFCVSPQKRKDILKEIGYQNHASYFTRYIEPLIKHGFLDYTLPDKLTSPKQRYKTTSKGIEVLKDKKV